MVSQTDPPKRTNIPAISITTSTTNLNAGPEEYAIEQGDVGALVTPPLSPQSNLASESPSSSQSHAIHLHHRSGSDLKADPHFLSPTSLAPILREPSSSAPSSPSASDQASVSTAPPSPTLSSHSSVHFQQPTTLSLRDNHPGSGVTSLRMLSPEAPYHHRRNGSNTSHTTSLDESTESGTYVPLTPTSSQSKADGGSMNTAASPTTTAVDAMSNHGESGPEVKGKERAGGDDGDSVAIEESPGDGNAEGTSEAVTVQLDAEDPFDPAPFEFNPSRLASLVDPKNLDLLIRMGGISGLIKGLGTHALVGLSKRALGQDTKSEVGHGINDGGGGVQDGISPHQGPYMASVEDRRRVYGENNLPPRRSKTLLMLMWLVFKDKVLVLLSIAAIVSLALGLFTDFGTPPQTVQCGIDPVSFCKLPQVDWVEGVAIMVAIIIVVVVGSLNDWQKERQFQKLNEKKEDRGMKVIRHGDEMVINVKEVLVGDIAILEPGEVVPCDGVFIRGHGVQCDESSATGEADAISKASYERCLAEKESGRVFKRDCFIVSGSKVVEGVGTYVVIAVGTRSFNGRIMMALRGDSQNTPLQFKLNALAELIAKLGSGAGLILFGSLMIRFFVQLATEPHRSPSNKAMSFVQILIISVTLIVVAVPEGLPLAVTLALAFATKRMTKENLLVRVLGSCETMANASVVCTDKTGTLTENVMSVVAGSIGIHCKFVHRLDENQARTDAQDNAACARKHTKDFSIDQGGLNKVIRDPLRRLFNEAIAINSTAFEDLDAKSGRTVFVGSKTETALLHFARDLQWENYHKTREGADIVHMFPFSSERKAMGVVVRTSGGKWRFYLKGASEILAKRCTRHVVVPCPDEASSSGLGGMDDENMKYDKKYIGKSSISEKGVETREVDELGRDNISRSIIFYSNQMLRTLALCYREFNSWPPRSGVSMEEIPWSVLTQDLTLIAIVGIEDPLRANVRDAVATCQKAGVAVKMCTGDNAITARSIAMQCGMYTAGGIIMEGPVFRGLSSQDMREIVPRLQVLARSSPEDKKLLVSTLCSLGETVGVTGDGTNDGPALKAAHVGFSMGITGTEVAKEASDIILMDDNFASIVNAIMWGRCVNDAVRKFLQFQLSVNIAAVIVTFVSAVASNTESPVLAAVQLLWINLIMDTFAALALATDPASPALLNRKPDPRSAPLFSVPMGKQIFGQAIYQSAIVLIFHFAGNLIFGYQRETNPAKKLHNDNVLKTLVFNIFVFCQVFNSVNCRSINNDKNVFAGITRNWYFIVISLIEICVQILIVFFGGAAFQVTSIGIREWGISLALASMTLPIGFLLRLVPDELAGRWFDKLNIFRKREILPTVHPDQDDWNPAIQMVRDNLTTFANVRGGRLRSSSFVVGSRSARLTEGRVPSLLTMVPTLVASSVGAGWSPKPGLLSDPSNADPSRSSAALWDGKVQLHPDTKPDDIAYQKWGQFIG